MSEIYKFKIKFMISKILIGSGILMIFAGVVPIVWQIYRIMREPNGIGAIGGSLFALVCSLIVGAILIFVGVVKLYKNSKALK